MQKAKDLTLSHFRITFYVSSVQKCRRMEPLDTQSTNSIWQDVESWTRDAATIELHPFPIKLPLHPSALSYTHQYICAHRTLKSSTLDAFTGLVNHLQHLWKRRDFFYRRHIIILNSFLRKQNWGLQNVHKLLD